MHAARRISQMLCRKLAASIQVGLVALRLSGPIQPVFFQRARAAVVHSPGISVPTKRAAMAACTAMRTIRQKLDSETLARLILTHRTLASELSFLVVLCPNGPAAADSSNSTDWLGYQRVTAKALATRTTMQVALPVFPAHQPPASRALLDVHKRRCDISHVASVSDRRALLRISLSLSLRLLLDTRARLPSCAMCLSDAPCLGATDSGRYCMQARRMHRSSDERIHTDVTIDRLRPHHKQTTSQASPALVRPALHGSPLVKPVSDGIAIATVCCGV